MCDPLRIALVAEGPTDRIVLEAALRATLNPESFILTQLQPEGSIAFGATGAGWAGVYKWCKQAAQRGGGRLADDTLLFGSFDVLVLHLDADVAGKRYSDASITPAQADGALPCEQPCPPASATTDALRAVLLTWCGDVTPPSRTVACVPSKSTEAWVVAALFPDDPAVRDGIECYPDPETRLSQQPITKRMRKTQRDYQAASTKLESRWPRLAVQTGLGEAHRFQEEVRSKLPAK
jgi:hypothetical protein